MIASGLLGMFQYAGQSLGVAFGGAVFATFATASGSALHSLPSPADMSSLASDPAAQEAMGNASSTACKRPCLLSPFLA